MSKECGDITREGKELKRITHKGISEERAIALALPWLKQGKPVQITWEEQKKYADLDKATKLEARPQGRAMQ